MTLKSTEVQNTDIEKQIHKSTVNVYFVESSTNNELSGNTDYFQASVSTYSDTVFRKENSTVATLSSIPAIQEFSKHDL